MKLVFLGTGTSQGVPMIAQPIGVNICDLNNPKNWRTRTSIHLEMDGFNVQVDASPEFRLQCINNDIKSIDVFILTHAHADHIMGMDDLRRFCDIKGGIALPVYSNEISLKRIQEIFPYAIKDKPISTGYPAFNLIKMPQILETQGGRIHAVPLPHGTLDVLGLLFEEKSSGKRLAYFTDCKEITEKAFALAKNVDVLIIDGLRPKEHPTHMSINEAVFAAQKINASKTFITHMTHFVDHDEVEASLPENIFLAYDGLTINEI